MRGISSTAMFGGHWRAKGRVAAAEHVKQKMSAQTWRAAVMTELTPTMGIIVCILVMTRTDLWACLAASIMLAIGGMA